MKLEEYICKDCDFNYIISDEHGVMQYCLVMDLYEEDMMKLNRCEHYRKDGEY